MIFRTHNINGTIFILGSFVECSFGSFGMIFRRVSWIISGLWVIPKIYTWQKIIWGRGGAIRVAGKKGIEVQNWMCDVCLAWRTRRSFPVLLVKENRTSCEKYHFIFQLVWFYLGERNRNSVADSIVGFWWWGQETGLYHSLMDICWASTMHQLHCRHWGYKDINAQ